MPTDPKKQNIVVLAEAPLKPTLKIEDYLYEDKDASKLPKELGDIFNEYKSVFAKYQELDDLRIDAIRIAIANYSQENPDIPYTELNNSDFDTKIVQPTLSIIGESTNNQLKELTNKLASLYSKFELSSLNPKKVSDTFPSEGRNLKTFFGDKANVDVLPIYKGQTDEKAIVAKLKNMKPTDKVIFLGHRGERLGGYTHQELTDIINQSPASECHMGSCDFENYVDNFKGLKDKTLYYRPNSKYLGIDPTADNFMDAMYGRISVNGVPNRTKAVEGVNYKTKKFKRGGVVVANSELESLKRLKI